MIPTTHAEAALEGHQLAVEACAMQCGRPSGRAVTKDCRGVNGALAAQEQRVPCYSAGVMVLSEEDPCLIRYRSAEPVLTPELPQERWGIVANVVFPTGIDRRDELGSPDRFDVYYGMADNRIGVARLNVPDCLPPGAVAHAPGAKV